MVSNQAFHSLEQYRKIVGDDVIAGIYRKARQIYGREFLHVNSTYQGGGVAEILSSLVPLMNSVGLWVDWRIVPGSPDFFMVTKKFHHALHGDTIRLTDMKKRVYVRTNEDFAQFAQIFHDAVIVHDPHPLPLVRFYHKQQPWIWRCHVDLTSPNEEVWDFLMDFVIHYDMIIVSHETFVHPEIPIEQRIIPPAIDPLSPKNIPLGPKVIDKYLKKFHILTDKPLLTQIARFDKWKDPEGLLEVWRLVRRQVDCRLVMCGSMAADDPEAWEIFERIQRKAREYIQSRDVLLITTENHILVNALQRASAVIIQKSTREGFGLSVTEALWKGKPVVASAVGGIPSQIQDGENGFLVQPHDIEGFAHRIVQLLENPTLAESMGERARASVRARFLMPRLLSDYLDLFMELLV